VSVFITVLHVLVCLILIVVVLLQRGKGAEIGAVFGGGASTTVFGSRGAGNFFTKLTTGAAVVFMLTSLVLSYLGKHGSGEGLFGEEELPVTEETAPAPGAADEAESPFVEVQPPAERSPAQESPGTPETAP
jgi:preprotein translocase subunit SecG